jgi:uncharacterized protein
MGFLKKFERLITWQRISVEQIHFKRLEYETNFLSGYAIFYIGIAFLTALLISWCPLQIMGAWDFNHSVWYTFFFKIAMLLIVPLTIYLVLWKYSLKDLLYDWHFTPRKLIFIAMAFIAGFMINIRHLNNILAVYPNFDDALMRAFIAILLPLFIAGLPEEIFFRALLQTHLEKKLGRISGMVIATLLFTAWHLPSRYFLAQGVEGQAHDLISVLIGTGIPVFIIGFVFALFWDRYRNLPALVMAHWAIDILPSLSSFFQIHF